MMSFRDRMKLRNIQSESLICDYNSQIFSLDRQIANLRTQISQFTAQRDIIVSKRDHHKLLIKESGL